MFIDLPVNVQMYMCVHICVACVVTCLSRMKTLNSNDRDLK